MSGPAKLEYNRQVQVLADRHPDCGACALLEEYLNQQIVANGVLRLLVLDLREELRKAGREYDLSDYPTTRDAVERHPAAVAGCGLRPRQPGDCCHGVSLRSTCDDCGRVYPNGL